MEPIGVWVVVDGKPVIATKVVEEAVVKRVERTDFSPPLKVSDLFWDNLTGCYMFVRNGIHIGIEPDGYMHS